MGMYNVHIVKRDRNGYHYQTVTCDVCKGDGGVWMVGEEIVDAEGDGAKAEQCPCCYGDGTTKRYLDDDDGPDCSDDDSSR